MSYDDYIVRDILANNSFSIAAVIGLRSIKSMFLDREKYPIIVSWIQAGNLDELINLPTDEKRSGFREYLEVMQFESQDGRSFIVSVYDSDELWQDPQVIEIFPLTSI